MNTMKSVYNKLFKEETQLASHEVELASATDLPKLYGNATSMANDLLGDTARRVDALKAVLKKKEADGIKLIADLDGAMIDFAKKAKDLGIDPKTAPLYIDSKKELDDLYKGVKLVQALLNGLNK